MKRFLILVVTLSAALASVCLADTITLMSPITGREFSFVRDESTGLEYTSLRESLETAHFNDTTTAALNIIINTGIGIGVKQDFAGPFPPDLWGVENADGKTTWEKKPTSQEFRYN